MELLKALWWLDHIPILSRLDHFRPKGKRIRGKEEEGWGQIIIHLRMHTKCSTKVLSESFIATCPVRCYTAIDALHQTPVRFPTPIPDHQKVSDHQKAMFHIEVDVESS